MHTHTYMHTHTHTHTQAERMMREAQEQEQQQNHHAAAGGALPSRTLAPNQTHAPGQNMVASNVASMLPDRSVPLPPPPGVPPGAGGSGTRVPGFPPPAVAPDDLCRCVWCVYVCDVCVFWCAFMYVWACVSMYVCVYGRHNVYVCTYILSAYVSVRMYV
jgi:hypothetical protein